MRRILLWGMMFAVAVTISGCSGKAEKFADKVNDKMVEKIEKGEVKNEADMFVAFGKVAKEVQEEMGIKDDEKTSEADEKKGKEKMEKYMKESKDLIKKKWPEGK